MLVPSYRCITLSTNVPTLGTKPAARTFAVSSAGHNGTVNYFCDTCCTAWQCTFGSSPFTHTFQHKRHKALSKALLPATTEVPQRCCKGCCAWGLGSGKQRMLTCLSNALQEGCSIRQQVQGCFHCRPHEVCVHRRQRSIVCLTGRLRHAARRTQTLAAAEKHSHKIFIIPLLHRVHLFRC